MKRKEQRVGRTHPKPRTDSETYIKAQVYILGKLAEARGISPEEFFAIAVGMYLEEKGLFTRCEGYASPAEGLAELLMAEGGCVTTDVARSLYPQQGKIHEGVELHHARSCCFTSISATKPGRSRFSQLIR